MLFYNSSMPRSGSALLQNVLGQNPSIHVTPTDGVLELLYSARQAFSSSPEFRAQDGELMEDAFKEFCFAGLDAYAHRVKGDKDHICIKSRGIGIHYDWFNWFLDDAPKIICMVRNAKAVLSSMEKLHRKDPQRFKGIDHASLQNTTTDKRVSSWLNSPPVGLALERFIQMSREGILDKCLVVRYEDFTQRPAEELKRVYEYLGLEQAEHDFSNVEQLTVEDDEVYGISGLHEVKKEVKPQPADWNKILGEGLSEWVDAHPLVKAYQKLFGYM